MNLNSRRVFEVKTVLNIYVITSDDKTFWGKRIIYPLTVTVIIVISL
jgi:hypothetical protein